MDNLFKNKFRVDSTRLRGWDYSSCGYYFVTVCVKHREGMFGRVKNGRMMLSEIGMIAEKCWIEIPCHFPFIELDEHVIMPDHVHGIIIINKNDNVGTQDVKTQDVGTQNVGTQAVETQDTCVSTTERAETKSFQPAIEKFGVRCSRF